MVNNHMTDRSRCQTAPRKACLFSVSDAVKCAERIGYPVMLKASEGATVGAMGWKSIALYGFA